ncbi:MAG: hypothetical protein AAGJ10_03680, partial [Bacteroidota bacterium]
MLPIKADTSLSRSSSLFTNSYGTLHMTWSARLGLLSILLLSAWRADAQVVQWVKGTQPGTFVFEATWSQSLQAAVDSAGLKVLDDDAIWRLAEGSFTASHMVYVGTATPQVEVISASYDEVDLPAAALTLPMDQRTEVVGVGTYRKQQVGTLVWRTVQYDVATQRLRRYRRAVVRVSGLATGDQRARRVASAKAFSPNPHLQVTESVLSRGTVFKYPVTEEGIYRIDRAFLSALPGINPDAIDPARVQVFGNGGKPLPALNSDPRYADLAENPVLVQGDGDGSFGNNDAVWFYGASPTSWTYLDAENRWQHTTHPFADTNYYFIRIDEAMAKTAEVVPYPGWTDAAVQSEVPGRFVAEFDEVMWSREHGSGHTWVSRVLNSTQRRRELLEDQALTGFDGGAVEYRVRLGIQSNPRSSLNFSSNGQFLFEERAARLISQLDVDAPIASASVATFAQTVSSNALNLTVELPAGAGTAQAAVDWVQVFYPQQLRAEANVLRFAFPVTEERLTFDLSGFSAPPIVLDITEPHAIRALGVQAQGATYRVQAERGLQSQREFIAFVPSAAIATSAALARPVGAQNLHGVQSYPDLVIVAPEP